MLAVFHVMIAQLL